MFFHHFPTPLAIRYICFIHPAVTSNIQSQLLQRESGCLTGSGEATHGWWLSMSNEWITWLGLSENGTISMLFFCENELKFMAMFSWGKRMNEHHDHPWHICFWFSSFFIPLRPFRQTLASARWDCQDKVVLTTSKQLRQLRQLQDSDNDWDIIWISSLAASEWPQIRIFWEGGLCPCFFFDGLSLVASFFSP